MSLTLPLALLIVIVAVLARRTEGSWAAPAALFATVWAGILLIAALIFPDLDQLTSAAVYITLGTIAVWVGSLLGRGFDPAPGEPLQIQALPFLRAFLVFSLVTGLGYATILFARRGFSISQMISLIAIIQVTLQNRGDLFGGLQQAVWEWVIFLVLYTSTLFGGVLLRLRQRRTDLPLAASAPAMIAFVFSLYGSRVAALYGGAFFVGAYLATSVLTVEDPRIFSPRALVTTLGVGAVIVLGFSILTMGLRYATVTPAGGVRAIFADGFSFPATMGIWLEDRGFVGTDFTAGARTFSRLVGPIGIRAPLVPAIPVGFTSSNIYTIFRDVMEDFGTVGSAVFFLGFGYVGRLFFSRARAGQLSALAPLTMVYAFILTSPADGIFYYTVSVAALFLFAFYMWSVDHSAYLQSAGLRPAELGGATE